MFPRRSVLTGSAALAISPVFAQQTVAQTNPSPNDPRGDSIELRLVQQTLAIGAVTLLTSKIAVREISVPKLKAFAILEVAEQETLWGVLKSLQDPDATRGEPAAPADAELEAHLVPLGRQRVQSIRTAEGGTGLAHDYFLLQVDAHQQLLRLQEEYLKVGRDSHYLMVVKLVDSLAREHLQLLGDFKTDVDAGKGAAPPGR